MEFCATRTPLISKIFTVIVHWVNVPVKLSCPIAVAVWLSEQTMNRLSDPPPEKSKTHVASDLHPDGNAWHATV